MSTTKTNERDRAESEPAGAQADKPTDIPPQGWKEIARRGWREASADQVPLLSAGVAFFSFLALFPGLIALTLLYGLFADPSTVQRQLAQVTSSLPPEARALREAQLQQLASAPTQGLGWGLVISLLIALWTASGGVGNLVTDVNIAYDEERHRGFVKGKVIALGLTIGAVLFMILATTLIAGLPVIFELVGLTPNPSSRPERTAPRVRSARWVNAAPSRLTPCREIRPVPPTRTHRRSPRGADSADRRRSRRRAASTGRRDLTGPFGRTRRRPAHGRGSSTPRRGESRAPNRRPSAPRPTRPGR